MRLAVLSAVLLLPPLPARAQSSTLEALEASDEAARLCDAIPEAYPKKSILADWLGRLERALKDAWLRDADLQRRAKRLAEEVGAYEKQLEDEAEYDRRKSYTASYYAHQVAMDKFGHARDHARHLKTDIARARRTLVERLREELGAVKRGFVGDPTLHRRLTALQERLDEKGFGTEAARRELEALYEAAARRGGSPDALDALAGVAGLTEDARARLLREGDEKNPRDRAIENKPDVPEPEKWTRERELDVALRDELDRVRAVLEELDPQALAEADRKTLEALLAEKPLRRDERLDWLGRAYALVRATRAYGTLRRYEDAAAALESLYGDRFLDYLEARRTAREYAERLRRLPPGEERERLAREYLDFLESLDPERDFEKEHREAEKEVERRKAETLAALKQFLAGEEDRKLAEEWARSWGDEYYGPLLRKARAGEELSEEELRNLAALLVQSTYGREPGPPLKQASETLGATLLKLDQARSARDEARLALDGQVDPWARDERAWIAKLFEVSPGESQELNRLLDRYELAEQARDQEARERGVAELEALVQNPPDELLELLRESHVRTPGALIGDLPPGAQVKYDKYDGGLPRDWELQAFGGEPGPASGEAVQVIRWTKDGETTTDYVFLGEKGKGRRARKVEKGGETTWIVEEPSGKQVILRYKDGRLEAAETVHVDAEGRPEWRVVHVPSGKGEYVKAWFDANGRKVLEELPKSAVQDAGTLNGKRLWVVHSVEGLDKLPPGLAGMKPEELANLKASLRHIFLERGDAVTESLKDGPIYLDPDGRRGFTSKTEFRANPANPDWPGYCGLGHQCRITNAIEFSFDAPPSDGGKSALYLKGFREVTNQYGYAPPDLQKYYDVRYWGSPDKKPGTMFYQVDQKFGTKDSLAKWARESSLLDTTVAWAASFFVSDAQMKKDLDRMAYEGLQNYASKPFWLRTLEGIEVAGVAADLGAAGALFARAATKTAASVGERIGAKAARESLEEALVKSGRFATAREAAAFLERKSARELSAMHRALRSGREIPGLPRTPGGSRDPTLVSRAEKVLKDEFPNGLSKEQKRAVREAHEFGEGQVGKDGLTPARIGNYTEEQIARKARILREAGFDEKQVRALMEHGIVGAPPGKLADGAKITIRSIPRDGVGLESRLTKKGHARADRAFATKTEAHNYARRLLSGRGRIERLYGFKKPGAKEWTLVRADEMTPELWKKLERREVDWLGWENMKGDRAYLFDRGDWWVGPEKSRFPHVNWEIGGDKGHFFMMDEIAKNGLLDDFNRFFGVEIVP